MAGGPAHDLGQTLALGSPWLLSADGPVLWKIRQNHLRSAVPCVVNRLQMGFLCGSSRARARSSRQGATNWLREIPVRHPHGSASYI